MLLTVSLIFYAWGEVSFIFLLLASTIMNYFLGLLVERSKARSSRKAAAALAVAFNIGLLAFFKYADFFAGSLNSLLSMLGGPPLRPPHIPLPIGISFFTFHTLSYVIDIYRRKWKAATDPKDVALYIFFFPQLVAGPILRWNAIAPQLLQRRMSRESFVEGIRRFAGGLAKKVILANTMAVPADQIFSLNASELSAPVAWFGTLCYTLQIYFDFSGYSDMAIGLGKMFGFHFIENFNFPYIAQSLRDFWKRWHISLSSWFRDYLYIPMGGSHVSTARTCFNLMTVFLLCGLWHGASWTFVVWGLYHGMFLVLERTKFGELVKRLPRLLRHVYAVLAIMMGWVLFRSNTFAAAKDFFLALSGLVEGPSPQPLARYATAHALWAILLAIPFTMPLWSWVQVQGSKIALSAPPPIRPFLAITGTMTEALLITAILLMSSASLAGGTYNPFIYFRF